MGHGLTLTENASYAEFIKEIDRGHSAGTTLPVVPPLFEDMAVAPGGSVKLNGPQGSFAKQPFGPPSPGYPTAKPPAVGDDDYAVELAELYWASLLRDVPFTQFAAGTSHPVITAAVKHLNHHIAHYRGPVDEHTGKVTPRLLFRGGLPKGKRSATDPEHFTDEAAGPYVSQLCLWPTNLGTQPIDQKMQTFYPGQAFMTELGEWYQVQQGISTGRQVLIDPVRRYMRDGRGLAAFTRQDELFQAYFVAYLVMKTLQIPPNPGNPYQSYRNQQAFSDFGGPDIAGTLGIVAKAAINAVWYQKWAQHLRHRPEAGAGLVHLWKTKASPLPQAAAFGSTFANILDPPLKMSSDMFSRPGATADKDKSFLLAQAFPEGSPPHPAYPTGHGTVAGACITVLKFFFDCDRKFVNIVQPQIPADDGLTLVPYTEPDALAMTLNGELHKLAHNISFGHGVLAGIHWRSDTDESLLLGEQVAIAVLKDLIKLYPEKCSITFSSMANTPVSISN